MMTEDEFQAFMNTIRGEKLSEDLQECCPYTSGMILYRKPRAKVQCADGFAVSIQAGWGKYSTPRCDSYDEYSSWELGFPTDRPTDAVMEYCENPEKPTETVYGHVPTKIVIDLLSAHGGLAGAGS